MKFVQAQFSLKYDLQVKIRRSLNEIEDFLQCYYGIPQTIPLPDEIAPEALRIILYSKNGHSQISFSQISVDFLVNFDNDFLDDFTKTQQYIKERVNLIIELLKIINIKEYLFCGITYNTRFNIGEQKTIEFIRPYLGKGVPEDNLYEALRNIVLVEKQKFFINQQIGTYKEFQARQGVDPNLFELINNALVSEGISLVTDINNRYQYVYQNKKNSIDACSADVDTIFSLLIEHINRRE